MNHNSVLRHFGARGRLAAFTAFVALAGCTSDDAAPVQHSLDASFLGYSNPDTRQTTCGNCHISFQRSWVQTRHASAWQDLENSGHAAPSCYNCHTVNGTSNQAPDTSGFFAVAADAQPFYRDVQCESCHGPGATHVSSPDESQPLSTIVADTLATTGCATCHQGAHNPFVEQWQRGAHGAVITSAASRPAADGCPTCHEGKAALAKFDPNAKYQEQGSTTLQPITCAVCHDPHGGPNTAQLRYPIDVPDVGVNLCMQCHQRSFAPSATSSRGAHSPQGPMLLGEAGWIPPNFAYDEAAAASAHGGVANPRLCAGCHVERFSVTDAATGAFLVQSTGHLFGAIPCVDANGAPTGATGCPDAQRRFNACSSSGCHSSAANASAFRQVLAGRLQTYQDVLWKDKDNDGTLDPLPIDSGLLAQVRLTTPGDFSTTGTGGTIITVGEGVWFNADLVRRADGSNGVHNPIYAEALLLASTTALRAQYTYLPIPPAQVQARLAVRMRRLGMRP